MKTKVWVEYEVLVVQHFSVPLVVVTNDGIVTQGDIQRAFETREDYVNATASAIDRPVRTKKIVKTYLPTGD